MTNLEDGIRRNLRDLLTTWMREDDVSSYWTELLEGKYRELALEAAMREMRLAPLRAALAE